MAHTPVNHPLRPLYRGVAAAVGLYEIAFGVVGLLITGGDGLFAQNGDRVLGQGANLAWSVVSLVLGVVVLVATLLGRNRDAVVDQYAGWALMVVGTLSLAFLRTGVNVLDFSVATVVVCYLAGVTLMLAGLYVKTAPREATGAPRQVREGRPA